MAITIQLFCELKMMQQRRMLLLLSIALKVFSEHADPT
jgi:hypothetical protein